MSDPEQHFLDAIANNPDDDEARAVYADWLEERGDPRGEFLRLELQLYKIPLRLAELANAIAPQWIDAMSRMYDVQLGNPGPNKISVIKAVRELTGLGLKDAKDVVDGATAETPHTLRKRIDRKEADSIAAKLAASGAMFQIVGVAGQLDASHHALAVEPRVSIALRSVVVARRLDAIKLVREVSELGLKDAKDLVDAVSSGGVAVTIASHVPLARAHELVTRFTGIGEVAIQGAGAGSTT